MEFEVADLIDDVEWQMKQRRITVKDYSNSKAVREGFYRLFGIRQVLLNLPLDSKVVTEVEKIS